ncbi:hypothetical protein Tco_0456154 [Tanacetum coccineum]
MSARGRDHRRQQPRNTAARTSGHATRDPRDVEIERLRERIRELEINPFNRYERQFEDTPIRSDVDETEEDDFENYFHDSPPQTPPRHHRQPPAPHHPTLRVFVLSSRGFVVSLLPLPPSLLLVPLPPSVEFSRAFATENSEFDGKLHPDDFLDWLQTVERIFDLRDIPDNVKVKLVAIKLKKYASLWWEHIQLQRYRNGKHKISFLGIRCVGLLLRAKFLPRTFKQDAYLDYKTSTRISERIFITEFERMRLRCGAEEDKEQVIARFLGVLRPDIADAVSLTQYYSFSEVVMQMGLCEIEPTKHTQKQIRWPIHKPLPVLTSTQTNSPQNLEPTKTETPKTRLPHAPLVTFGLYVVSKSTRSRSKALFVRRVLTSVVTPPDNVTTFVPADTTSFVLKCTSKRVVFVPSLFDGEAVLKTGRQQYNDELRCEVVHSMGRVATYYIGRPWLYGPFTVKNMTVFVTPTPSTKDGSSRHFGPLINPKDATPEVAPMTKDEIVGLARQSPPGPILGLVVLEENTPISDVPHEVLPLLTEFSDIFPDDIPAPHT